MTFQAETDAIRWKVHFKAGPSAVFDALSTDQGRASFWAESAVEENGSILFVFPNRAEWKGQILEQSAPRIFCLTYYGGSRTVFELESDGSGGTDLTLTDQGIPEQDRAEVTAGWVSVLMALKASVDFGVDIRNHDPRRTWDAGYVEN